MFENIKDAKEALSANLQPITTTKITVIIKKVNGGIGYKIITGYPVVKFK